LLPAPKRTYCSRYNRFEDIDSLLDPRKGSFFIPEEGEEKMTNLGALCWFEVSTKTKISRETLDRELKEQGITISSLPRQRGYIDALRIALREVESARIPSPDPGQTHKLVLGQIRREGGWTWHVHMQVCDSRGKQVSYEEVARVSYHDTLDVTTLPSCPEEVISLLESLGYRTRVNMEYLDHGQIRTMIEEAMAACSSMKVRPSVSFIREDKLPQLEQFAKILESLSQGNVRFSCYHIGDTQKNRKVLVNDIQHTVSETLAGIQHTLIHSRVSTALLKDMLESLNDVRLMIEYAGSLDQTVNLPEDVRRLEQEIQDILAL
jgi:hypothetical protein